MVKKKVNGNWNIINKNGYSTFHTGKPGNFNSLREVIWIILWHYYLEIEWRWASVLKKSVMVINILQMICIGHVLEAPEWTIPAEFCCRNLSKNCTARFYNHSLGMRSYLLESNFKFNLQKHDFVYVYEVIIKCYLNFMTCFIFPLL